jgi:hypothetical protein
MDRLSVAVCCAVLAAALPGADAPAAAPGLANTPVTAPAQPAAAAPGPAHAPVATPAQGTAPPQGAQRGGCLQSGNGYLRARIRGSLNLDIDWHNGEIECDGGARPDGSGIRVSFAGPKQSDGRRLRMVFGVGDAKEGSPGRELPTNLTVIFEGEDRLFTTHGDSRCTVDELQQERLGALGGPKRTYRIVARGFCVDPASTLSGDGRILVSRFDFAGNATFEDEER